MYVIDGVSYIRYKRVISKGTTTMPNIQPANLPVLSEGATYRMEIMSMGKVVRATLIRIAEDMPLGRGFSFQIGKRRQFVYERDLLPGPAGSLIATV